MRVVIHGNTSRVPLLVSESFASVGNCTFLSNATAVAPIYGTRYLIAGSGSI